MSLKIDTREVAHVTILDIHGRIVLGDEIGDLRDAVHNLVAEGKKKIILNLAGVDYIDSSGVGELVGCLHHRPQRRRRTQTPQPHPESSGRPLRHQALHRLRHQRRRIHRRKILRLLLRQVVPSLANVIRLLPSVILSSRRTPISSHNPGRCREFSRRPMPPNPPRYAPNLPAPTTDSAGNPHGPRK